MGLYEHCTDECDKAKIYGLEKNSRNKLSWGRIYWKSKM